ncbi:Heat shock protein 70 [Stanieria cyanosphaera PCC 7437]|uniref:Heat shock protein 70 n=1 Tax=Stanieria cyanosphaera (strain ATCC 29371 / PCC 7437) TaxID=111780 RepID=K9XY51_STAC7|nr:Hsp70 family protein [Stanieria cyanosphaera]AFZ37463.1 Heat shock protein 70 [Stanieria cyanosphaera PCC 7437]
MSVTSIENNAYAIDFGTSNTVVARWNSAIGAAETVKLSGLSQLLANNPPLIPSLVYVKDASRGKVILGQAVRDRGLDQTNDARFFRSFKRGIGTEIQGFLPELDEQLVTFEQVGEWFLKQLIAQLQDDCQANLQSLVLTVPVDSFEAYRLWLTDICHSLSVEQIRILDEPTAAALGYGAAEQELILVVDFGGGTVDLSLVQLSRQSQATQGFILKWGQKFLGESSSQKKATARVLAKAGQNLGGTDIDHWLVDYFAATQGLTKSSLTTRLAEKLKIQLSTQQEASEVYFNDETLESYQLNLDRSGLEKILQQQQFFAQLDELMTQVLQQARRNGIEKTDINAVLLVGGTVQMPAVQNWIKQYFDQDKISCDRPFEAIATGALAIAQGIQVQDFLYHSYGIRYWNRKQNCHSWHPIIQAGQPYPMAQPVELVLGASVENQPSIELIIGEMGVNNVGLEVYFDGDRLITRSNNDQTMTVKPLNDKAGARTIARLEPLGNPGSDRVKISFWVDQERYLRLSVEDLLTQTMLLNNQIVAELT